MERQLQGKKVAIIIAFRDFRDIEYFIPRNIFSNAGAEITTISTEKGIAIGADGGEVMVNLTLDQLNSNNFDALVFIGGSGASKLIDNSKVHQIIQQTLDNNKVLAAICIAPAILARAGVLKEKKATVWSSVLDKSAVKILKEEGAEYQDKTVVIDGKVITANGPGAAKEFAQNIIQVLTRK